jgi:hypothetical protein
VRKTAFLWEWLLYPNKDCFVLKMTPQILADNRAIWRSRNEGSGRRMMSEVGGTEEGSGRRITKGVGRG